MSATRKKIEYEYVPPGEGVCRLLAAYFLSGEPHRESDVDELAMRVQIYIEEWLQRWKSERRRNSGPSKSPAPRSRSRR